MTNMENLKIKIGDDELVFILDKKTFATYESIARKRFRGGLTIDYLGLMYAALISHNPIDITFCKFVDIMSDHENLFSRMMNHIISYYKNIASCL